MKLDHLESEDNTDIPVPLDIYEADTVCVVPRNNLDKKTNKYGDNLLSLCKSVPLRVCNGRKLGDILGSYTCYTPNGQSCVDYCLASPRIYDSIKTLSVGQPVLTLSDHCQVRAVLEVKINLQRVGTESYEFVDRPTKIAWNKDISVRFENLLQSAEYKSKFEHFLSADIETSQIGIDNASIEISNLLVSGALKADTNLNMSRKVNKIEGSRRKTNQNRASLPKWHDLSCCEEHRKVCTTA